MFRESGNFQAIDIYTKKQHVLKSSERRKTVKQYKFLNLPKKSERNKDLKNFKNLLEFTIGQCLGNLNIFNQIAKNSVKNQEIQVDDIVEVERIKRLEHIITDLKYDLTKLRFDTDNEKRAYKRDLSQKDDVLNLILNIFRSMKACTIDYAQELTS